MGGRRADTGSWMVKIKQSGKCFILIVRVCVMEQDTKAGRLFTEVMETEGMI